MSTLNCSELHRIQGGKITAAVRWLPLWSELWL